MDLANAFLEHVRERDLLPTGAHVVVACSGGGDSLALAALIAASRDELRLADVALAHLDHGLRPGSASDRAFVDAWAARRGMVCHSEARRVVPQPGESPEEAARRVRLEFLSDVASRSRATHVLTAHHADDQAETVLQRILRGTGLDGLAGIPEFRDLGDRVALVRPLLPFRRADLRAWLAEQGDVPREDPTNEDGNERARIRHRALPILRACTGRDPVPLLARLADNARAAEERRTHETAAGDVAAAFVAVRADAVTLATGFERLPRVVRGDALRRAVRTLRGDRPPSRDELDRLLDAAEGRTADSVSGLAVERRADGIAIVRAEAVRQPPEPVPLPALPAGGRTELWDGLAIEIECVPAGNAPFLRRLTDTGVEIADPDAIVGRLVAATRRSGERVHPLGAAAPSRLSHALQRRGIPAADRDRVPVVRDDEGIVWVAGVLIADRVRVTESTRRIAVLRLVGP